MMHAEVAGAGPAGLTCAIALAQRGWSVRVHERAPELRMYGAGIWLWENGLRVLDEVSVLDPIIEGGAQRTSAWEIRDKRGRVVWRRTSTSSDRMYVPTRELVYESLKSRAYELGVDIFTSSQALGADPAGVLRTAGGKEYSADLVVAADGVRSRVRGSLNVSVSTKSSGVHAIRTLVSRPAGATDAKAVENWGSNGRSLLFNPVSPDLLYLCFVSQGDDESGHRVPIDTDSWAQAFPQFADVIEQVGDEARSDEIVLGTCEPWAEGRVAIIGDAAHALPPTLGQGANLAFMNALALAEFVSCVSPLEESLRCWENAMRPITTHTQRWSSIYNAVSHLLPEGLGGLKTRVVGAFAGTPFVERRLNKAARFEPIGTAGRRLSPA